MAGALMISAGCASSGADAEGGSVTPEASVPQKVATAHLTRTRMFPRGVQGQIYGYVDGSFRPDVYVYPKDGWPDARTQGEDFHKTLKMMRFDREIGEYHILLDEQTTVTANGREYYGHEIVFTTVRRGLRRDSYFLVLALPEQYIKFRITQNPSAESMTRSRAFVREWLTAYTYGRTQPAEPTH